MISRRGLFKMLGAVAASPALKPLAKLCPEYTTFLLPEGAVSYRYTYSVRLPPSPAMMIRIRKIAPQSFYSGNKIAEPFIYERKS